MSPLSVEKIKSLLKGAYLLESIGIYTNLKAFSKGRRLDEGNSKGLIYSPHPTLSSRRGLKSE
jgi:hypothetical protein